MERRNTTKLSLKTMDDVSILLDVPKDKVACIDIETTGLKFDTDEILQVSICDGNEKILLDSYVCPSKRRRWNEAQKIHGITWAMVKDSPSIVDLSEQIERILGNADLIIGYNIIQFDFEFLRRGRVNLPTDKLVYDVMLDCSVLYGKWSDYYKNYSYVSLKKMAEIYDIAYKAHDSAQDVIATVKVFYSLLEDEKLTSAISESERSRRKVSNRLVKNVTTVEAETDKVKQMVGRLPKAVLIAIAIVVLIFLTTCISTLRGR